MAGDQQSIFERLPEARKEENPLSRFRSSRRPLSAEELALNEAIIAKAAEIERLFNCVKSGRYRSLAFTALEESIGWIEKEISS